jgi:uncharacterized protein (TIGR00290 family)
MSRPRLLLSWSSGKDSAWTLHVLRERGEYEIVGLVTTINDEFERVAMHAVRVRLLELQAQAVGLPLWKIGLPHPCSNEQYESAMSEVIARARADAVEAFAFGDLFLEDIRRYRERQLAGTGIAPVFPLWGRPTAQLARDMVASGLRAVVTCVDPRHLDAGFAGREFDASFIDDLPAGADPCGENGEFHTFAYDGPMFQHPVSIAVGERLERDCFVFADAVARGD